MSEEKTTEEKPAGEKRSKKDVWDILKSLGPAFLAAVVGVMGGWYNLQQTQLNKAAEKRQVYTNIMAERESSDNTIRAKMFEILINSMFEKGVGSATINTNNISAVQKQVMFLNLLSRNFDTVDVKPLFEDLDSDLTKKIYNEKDYSLAQRGDFFDMRYELRGIGKNLSVKQLNALASLEGSVVQGIVILKDKDGNIQTIKDESTSNGNGAKIPVEIKPNDISDGLVDISVEYTKTKSSDPSFKAPSFAITFYDLPYIDNSVLDADMRIGIILTKYVYLRDLDIFSDRLDKKLIKDYQDLKDGGITQFAEMKIIKFPAKYIGNRDKPYLGQILDELAGDQKEKAATK
jgi:hypothetical protein